jgi:hypothetical protein
MVPSLSRCDQEIVADYLNAQIEKTHDVGPFFYFPGFRNLLGNPYPQMAVAISATSVLLDLRTISATHGALLP